MPERMRILTWNNSQGAEEVRIPYKKKVYEKPQEAYRSRRDLSKHDAPPPSSRKGHGTSGWKYLLWDRDGIQPPPPV